MNCSQLPQIKYSEFSKRLHEKVSKNRIPISGMIEVTFRCNLRCAHCYDNLPVNDKEARSKELTYEEYCRILDEVAEEGCFWICFTGGDPFVRSDFLDIYLYAKRKGMIITVFTNGTTMSPRIADYLSQYPPFSIEITLYGMTKPVYESVTRVPGSYDRCMRGIQLLREHNLPFKLKTVVLTLNRHELQAMQEYAESLGVEFKFDAVINPRIDFSIFAKRPYDVRLTPQEVVALDVNDPKRLTEWKGYCERFVHPLNSLDLYNCGAGMNSYHIDPYGKLQLCTLSRANTFDLRTGSFKEGWWEFFPKLRSKQYTKMNKCVRCELKGLCLQCPAMAELEFGTPEDPVEYLCTLGHLRAKAFGLNHSCDEHVPNDLVQIGVKPH